MSLLEGAIEAIPIPRKIWTREEARQLIQLGFPNAEKLELINGELINRMGKNRPHSIWKTLVGNWLRAVFGPEFVQTEDPIDVAPEDNPINEPEPDLVVTARSVRNYTENPQPADLRLVVEISDTTAAFDRRIKAQLYARAGIAEYWIVQIPEKQLIVHREPRDGVYTAITIYAGNEPIAPLAAPHAQFCLDKL